MRLAKNPKVYQHSVNKALDKQVLRHCLWDGKNYATIIVGNLEIYSKTT